MASVKDLLLSSLKELVNAELKKFQWYLVNDLEYISKSEMEDADRLKTVDTLVGCFGPEEEAVKITVDILRKMKQNHLAEQLENKHKQAQMSSGVHTGVSAVINTQKGGTVNAPVLAGNTTGPVTFNYSTAGHEPRKIRKTEKHTKKQGAGFVDKHRTELIRKVSLVEPVADDMKPLIGDEKYQTILNSGTRQAQMRALLDFLTTATLKEKLYQSLLEHERFLVEDLEHHG